MTDTRNRNNPGNFALEQRAADGHAARQFVMPNNAASIPGMGLGRAGTVAPCLLSANFMAIDSNLRGIGVANLVKPNQNPAVAQLYPLPVTNIVPAPNPLFTRPQATALPGARPSYL